MSYRDRTHAGAVLAEALATALPADAGRDDVVVLGLPRGGVPVAARVAAALNAPLDVMVVRKLGVPGHEELAFGALASGGVRVLNHEVVAAGRVSPEEMARVTERAAGELASAERRLRGDRPPPELAGRVVVLVDDGLATGASMEAAVTAARAKGPSRVVVAVPVGAPSTCRRLEAMADVVCPLQPERFFAVGEWYDDFGQTSDREVLRLLSRAN